MNKIILLLIVFLSWNTTLLSQITEQTIDGNICPADPWFLIFEDEFIGTTLNTSKWASYIPGGPNGSDACIECRTVDSNTLVIYKDENVVVGNGTLKILTKKENASWYGIDRDYTSGMINAKKSITFNTFQKWEARIKLSKDPGFWSAFWAFGHHNEIDFFEYYSSDELFTFNTHWWEIPNVTGQSKYKNLASRDDLNLSDDWHIFAAEYDPFYIRFYIDGILIHTFPKLKSIVTNQPVTGCTVPAGTYFVDPAFPFDGAPMVTKIGNNVWKYDLPDLSDHPDTMEVDYVRIYSRGCPWTFFDRDVIVDEVFNNGMPSNFNSINIADNVTLTINNSNVGINDFGSINLGNGSKLILNNTTISPCNPNEKWKGIKAGKNAIIEMKNNSLIEKAMTGITIGDSPMNGQNPSTINDNPIIKIETNSAIKNCDVGIYLGAGRTASFIKDAHFEDNKVAIVTESSSGLIVDRTSFEDNYYSILSRDSYMHIRDANTFDGGEYGIIAEGTYPGSAGLKVGNDNSDYNTIFNGQNSGAIDCYGNEHPAGSYVVNTKFTNMAWSAMVFGGANRSLFENNTVENSLFGYMSEASGSNFNYAQCNVFNVVDGFDIHYAYDNSNSQFLGNRAVGAGNTNCSVVTARIAPNIGSALNPAGNCFSSSNDIVTQSSQHFNYHFYNNIAAICQNPTHSGNYSEISSEIKPDRCQKGVGVFKLIDPDGDGIKGFIIPGTSSLESYASHITKAQVSANIAQWIQTVVASGGDDPRTIINETTDSLSTAIFEKEETLDQWIRYALMRGMDSGDYGFAEGVLTPLFKVKWQQQLLGLKLMQAKYSDARTILANLPSRNTNENYFNEVQAINIKRLDGLNKGQLITSTEIQRLETIGRAHEPASAYARSIYHILTGDLIRYIPSQGSYMRDRENVSNEVENFSEIFSNEDVSIYPNPVDKVLHVSAKFIMSKVEIYDIQGNIQMTKIAQTQKIELNLELISSGLYIVRITDTEGRIRNYRTKKL